MCVCVCVYVCMYVYIIRSYILLYMDIFLYCMIKRCQPLGLCKKSKLIKHWKGRRDLLTADYFITYIKYNILLTQTYCSTVNLYNRFISIVCISIHRYLMVFVSAQ